MVVACVVAEPGCTEAEIIEFCRARLAPYKLPKQVKFLESLPESQIGKVLKRELRDSFMADPPRRSIR